MEQLELFLQPPPFVHVENEFQSCVLVSVRLN